MDNPHWHSGALFFVPPCGLALWLRGVVVVPRAMAAWRGWCCCIELSRHRHANIHGGGTDRVVLMKVDGGGVEGKRHEWSPLPLPWSPELRGWLPCGPSGHGHSSLSIRRRGRPGKGRRWDWSASPAMAPGCEYHPCTMWRCGSGTWRAVRARERGGGRKGNGHGLCKTPVLLTEEVSDHDYVCPVHRRLSRLCLPRDPTRCNNRRIATTMGAPRFPSPRGRRAGVQVVDATAGAQRPGRRLSLF